MGPGLTRVAGDHADTRPRQQADRWARCGGCCPPRATACASTNRVDFRQTGTSSASDQRSPGWRAEAHTLTAPIACYGASSEVDAPANERNCQRARHCSVAEILVRVIPKTFDDAEFVDLGGGGFVEKFKDRVSDVGDALEEVTNQLQNQLARLERAPSESRWHLKEVNLSVSLDLEAEAGVVLAKAKTSAGFEIQLTWSREP